MKILHVIVCLDVGGAEMMLKRLVESHKDNPGYEHVVVSLTDVGTVGRQIRDGGVEVIGLGMTSARQVLSIVLRLRALIRNLRPDIVQTWMYHADLLGGIAARLAGNRNVIWGIHSTNVRVGGSRATTVVMQACALLSRLVPRVILCVAEVSRKIHVGAGYDAGRMMVVPNGLNLSSMVATARERAELREQCGVSSQFVIGTLGRFNPAKDYQNFVRAAALVAERHPGVRFLMVGRQLDAGNSVLARWIAETGFADRFVLLGERSDPAICLAAMDVMCLSSRSEALPTVVAEAMAMSVPCVATDVGDTAALVADTGLIVPKEDPSRLAGALMKMIAMPPEERALLGRKAKQRIHAEYTIERARERLEAVYRGILTIKAS